MTKRYTVKRLEEDLVHLNQKLEKISHPYRFCIELFNGHTWVSLSVPRDLEGIYPRGSIHGRLEGGTPKECLAKAYQYLSGLI